MKVLHLHSGNLYGGVETFLLTLARSAHLAPSMQMAAALSFDGRIAEELRNERVPTSILGAVRLRRPDSVWRARRALARLLSEQQFDAAICHQAWPLAIFGPVVKSAGVPLVSWIHMAPTNHWIDRMAARVEPDLIICNSQFTASLCKSTATPVEVVYYPVANVVRQHIPDPSHTRRTRQLFDTPDTDVVIIQVSRMEAIKGHDVCLNALSRLAEIKGWTCWQVGGAQRPSEQEYVDRLRAKAEDLRIAGRVKFLGQRSDVVDLLAASDVYCQPNLGPEGFGITFIEAMAAGLPVVTTAIGGAREIVNETCGVLVPSSDASTLAASVAEALERLVTIPAERARLSHAGNLRAAALCDPASQMRRIATVLEHAQRAATVH